MNSPKLFKSKVTYENKAPTQYVFIQHIDNMAEVPIKMTLTKTFKGLLKEASNILNLPRPARQIFDEEGSPFTDIESIPPKSTLYVSMTDPSKEETDFPEYPSRLPKKNQSGFPQLKLPLMKTQKPKPKPENAPLHQSIASSRYVVKDNIRDAMLALYSSLTPEQKNKLPCSAALQKLQNDTQLYLVEHALLAHFIGPTSSIINSDLGKETLEWVYSKIEGVPLENSKFVFTGHSQSGKSTLLSFAVSLYFQKLLLANEATNYLIFPLNCKLYQLYIDDIAKIFCIIVKTTVSSLRAVRMHLMPLLDSLMGWLQSLVVVPAFPSFPQQILDFQTFPHEQVKTIGRQIHDAWNSKSSLEKFMTLAFSLPANIAEAFGMKGAIYVMDHLDAFGYMIDPVGRFRDSPSSVSMIHVICKVLESQIFFVASENDEDFFETFEIKKCKHYTTERIIKNFVEKDILISEPSMTLKLDHCRGCPGYVALYSRLVDFASKAANKAIKQPSISRFKSVVDHSRTEVVKQELFHLCILLSSSDAGQTLDESLMNDLMARTDIEVRVR